MTIEIKEISATDSMFILREKGRGGSSSNLLIRAASYDTGYPHNVLLILQINKFKGWMKIHRMVRITKK